MRVIASREGLTDRSRLQESVCLSYLIDLGCKRVCRVEAARECVE